MKEGEIVMIYMDAVNRQHPIGEAKLIKRINKINDLIEEWKVKYTDKAGFHEVIIKVK